MDHSPNTGGYISAFLPFVLLTTAKIAPGSIKSGRFCRVAQTPAEWNDRSVFYYVTMGALVCPLSGNRQQPFFFWQDVADSYSSNKKTHRINYYTFISYIRGPFKSYLKFKIIL